MATARKVTPGYELELRLSQEEAENLKQLTGKICNVGVPSVSNVYQVLTDAGVAATKRLCINEGNNINVRAA
jgi:hypothetical protein